MNLYLIRGIYLFVVVAIVTAIGFNIPELIQNSRAGNNKVEVCHFPPGNPDNFHTITVSSNAVDKHLEKHGDYLGPCRPECAHSPFEVGEILDPNCDPIVECVCDADEFCCDSAWDQICVNRANCGQDIGVCATICQCTSDGDCDDGVDCTVDSCTQLVCTNVLDESLCAAGELCDPTDGCTTCPETHSPFEVGEKLDPRCDDPLVQCVCDADPFCCSVEWDQICVNRANCGQDTGACTASCGGES